MDVSATIAMTVDRLKGVRGVSALVLGGSRAGGTASAASDIDIGIYYDPDSGLDIADLRLAAAELDDGHRENLITEIGGWGPWINGGGWLKVNRHPVDWLLRDRRKVSRVMEQCLRGDITIDYQPGHPHGFVNAIYMAEVAWCKPLWDPSGIVAELKAKTIPYPAAFRLALIRTFRWEAAFSLEQAHKGAAKHDLAYTAGCCFRTAACLNQLLFALNETYMMNEKGAAAIADSFSRAPVDYAHRVNGVFAGIGEDRDRTKQALAFLHEILEETERLLQDSGLL
ncbi:nucleotidyltransferase domain-containing protein [Paenibacillus cymbidii]|uniref:nucleotidyltransferase domain-containing protein n=1 Tax=Paenibacillus cymbidii TaxID=1639034 RepID=UPI001080D848|nr:nucleotidyltransferase domain-containing protein [Paenibacillus cymbidii]